ncbi:VOC family protein [Nocardia donostiensis]|uniref:Glyoxalase n=1 Tax=Nocardia donostiensis TaxID=1538463 RepID=A0A1W0BCR0_9NOCA|nr:VOC family protein [Nocardia donostiensis]ONM48062.1 glyoxalase [Nocardia donostiensis]OQS13951.1 glyoxalase [Nocardia donostiensis]OQS20293.1 glyoxalase [Nocardia donostiensis]
MHYPAAEPVMQVGYVVADLDAGIQQWVEHTGIGPWTVFRGAKLDGRYAGRDTTVTMDVAMGYTGELQIELMQITSSTPSPYANETGVPKLGPHHIAWITDDLDASVAQARERGLDVLFAAEGPGTKIAYLQSAAEPGVVFEYIQSDGMREMVAHGIEQARTWDGSDPVRVVSPDVPNR